MNAITLELTMDEIATPDDLRAAASEHLERAERLRAQADEEERSAWRLRAQAVLAEREAALSRNPVRRRPPIEGMPSMARNRVIALMERLFIDQPVHEREGLDAPLSLVEKTLGISYDRRGLPPVGMRIAEAESLLKAA